MPLPSTTMVPSELSAVDRSTACSVLAALVLGSAAPGASELAAELSPEPPPELLSSELPHAPSAPAASSAVIDSRMVLRTMHLLGSGDRYGRPATWTTRPE